MDGEQPIVGESKALVDGSPAEGEYLMPDGTTMIFVGGVLTEIKEAEVDDKAERIAELEKQLAEANAKVEAKESQIEQIANEVKAMKKDIKSSFKAEPVVAKKEEEKTTSDAKSALENLKQKRRK
jgi:chromosome segregation ATPase